MPFERSAMPALSFSIELTAGQGWIDMEFMMALGELRGVFVVYARLLADAYDITIHGPLAPVLSHADLEDERNR